MIARLARVDDGKVRRIRFIQQHFGRTMVPRGRFVAAIYASTSHTFVDEKLSWIIHLQSPQFWRRHLSNPTLLLAGSPTPPRRGWRTPTPPRRAIPFPASC